MKLAFLQKIRENIREFFSTKGYTCDGCGAEIFAYPNYRLCDKCEDLMRRNDGRICPKCGRKTRAEGVCLSCKSRAPYFTQGLSPFVYRGETAAFVNRLKNGNVTLAYYFSEKMADCFIGKYKDRFQGEERLLILPVPLTKERERERGYNQAEELANGIFKRLKEQGYSVEMDTEILQKSRDTAQQKHMGYASRTENVSGAYHVHKRKACRNRIILLVDDIMTTGATGSECAKKLLKADAKEVIFLVAASLPEME